MLGPDTALVLLAIAGLLATSAIVAGTRTSATAVGPTAGALTFVWGVAALMLHPGVAEPTPLQLDMVSLPRVPLTGLFLLAVFAVLPRRHATPTATAALLALAGLDLAVAVAPAGPVQGLAWLGSTLATAAVLPAGPARRLATPYLGLSAILGLAGSLVGGEAGTAMLYMAVLPRLGVFPFHSWVVGGMQLAPTTLAVAVAAPMSALALVARAPIGLDHDGAYVLTVALALTALLTAAWMLVQEELGRALGFFVVSVEAIVLISELDTNAVGHLGGLMMWGVTGLALLGMGLVTASLRSRIGEVDLRRYSGLAVPAPTFAGLFFLFGLASFGGPGTAAFASADLILHGGLANHVVPLLLFLGAVSLQGYAVLHLFFRVFLGPVAEVRILDALPRERVVLFGMAAVLIATGLAPQLLVSGWLGASEHAASPATHAVSHAAVAP